MDDMMQVNLFDNTFRQSVCSTAGAVPMHIEYVRDQMKHSGVTLFVDGFINASVVDEVESPVKIGWLHEPPCLIPQVYVEAGHTAHRFDAVLTYHPDLLALSGFRFMPYAGVWIPESEWGMQPKTHLVSMLVGDKWATEGHRIRHTLADAVAGLGVDFYGVRGVSVDYGWQTKLKVLGPYAFSIVGETCRIDNLFTEILLDCFAVGTIPIFWGCPNIGDYFDARGILNFETPAECAEIVAGLSWERYTELLPYAQENLRCVAPYAVAENWLYEHILRAYDD
jgi:hypothetical protein